MSSPIIHATVGRKKFGVQSWQQVSRAYRQLLEHFGLGASTAPPCLIVDQDDNVLAHVCHLGCVWKGPNASPGVRALIYDPRL